MFSLGELPNVFRYLPQFCLAFLIVYLLWRNVKLHKHLALPRSRKSTTSLFVKWMLSVINRRGFYGNEILEIISHTSHRYKEKGIFHARILFWDFVLLFNPNTVQQLLQNASNIDKSTIYSVFNEGLEPSLFLSNGEKWFKRRKLLTPAFHLRILDKFVPTIEEQAKTLVKKLMHPTEDGSIDIGSPVNQCVMNVVCETAMGLHIRNLNHDYSNYGKRINIILDIVQQRILSIWMWPDITFWLSPMCRQFKKSLNSLNEMTNQVIKERISQMKNEDQTNFCPEEQCGNKKQLAFLDILLTSLSNDPDFTQNDVMKEVLFFLSAGLHSTTLTITLTLYLLGKHLDIQKKVQEEVDKVLGDDADREISKKDLQDLKYTECVIKETLRLYPVVPLIARSASKEIIIGDYTIPAGFQCVVCIKDLHHDPNIFPNPDVFDPERHFPENCLGRHPYSFIPFSAGPRNCIGQKFSMLEMKIVIAKIIQSLTFESVDQNVEMDYAITLRPRRPVRLKFKRR